MENKIDEILDKTANWILVIIVVLIGAYLEYQYAKSIQEEVVREMLIEQKIK